MLALSIFLAHREISGTAQALLLRLHLPMHPLHFLVFMLVG